MYKQLRVWFQCERGYLGKSEIPEQFSSLELQRKERFAILLQEQWKIVHTADLGMFLLFPFFVLSFFESCLLNFFKDHFAPKIGAVIITDTNATAREFTPQCRQKWASSHLAPSGKESSQAGTAWTSVQISHQIQAIQHKLTSALPQLYWWRSHTQQSSQKTRIQEFNVEGNKHCPCVNRVFYRGQFVSKNKRCAEALKHKRKNPNPQSQVDYFLRRARGGIAVPVSLPQQQCLPCPWGQQCEIGRYTTGQRTWQFAVLSSFTLLIVLNENGFVHITMAKAAAILQLERASLQQMSS